MATKISIYNEALLLVGSALLTSPTDATKSAGLLTALYDTERDALLQSAAWSFATARANLPASTQAPAHTWAYAYPMPVDALRLVSVGLDGDWTWYDPSAGTAAFAYEGGAVLTDASSPLPVRFVQRVTNEGLFPPLFAKALSASLAVKVAEPLTQDRGKKDDARQAFTQAMSEARRANLIEQPPRGQAPGTWAQAAMGYESALPGWAGRGAG